MERESTFEASSRERIVFKKSESSSRLLETSNLASKKQYNSAHSEESSLQFIKQANYLTVTNIACKSHIELLVTITRLNTLHLFLKSLPPSVPCF